MDETGAQEGKLICFSLVNMFFDKTDCLTLLCACAERGNKRCREGVTYVITVAGHHLFCCMDASLYTFYMKMYDMLCTCTSTYLLVH